MSSITDILNLNKLNMFQTLRKVLETNSTSNIRNLLAYKDQMLYVWNPDECCLYSLLLSTTQDDNPSYQKLYPGSPPLFDVDEILINEPGTMCALVGSNGVSVMRFPKRFGFKSLYDNCNRDGGGITCRTSLLQDKLFVSKQLTDVKRVRWYPGSPEDNHLLMLANNKNCLRLYKVDENSGKLLSVWQLGQETSRFSVSLGETAVDFDFAPPVLVGDQFHSEPSIIWPIIVLQGNGEVLCLNTTIDESMNIKSAKISGPMTMYPSADDNYSEDASSILILDTVPPSVVIASNFGQLYNCLLLPDTKNKKDNNYEPNEYKPEYSLHIIETVELELGLNISNNEECENSNIVQLRKDAILSHRYWCLHNTGVHSVTMPLTELLDEFSKDVKEDDCRGSPNIQGQSSIEYYICTGLMNGEKKPIKGFAVINFPTDLLVTVLSTGEVVTQTIQEHFYNKTFIEDMFIDKNEPIENVDSSDICNKDDFSSFISALLQKGNGTKNTILKLGSNVSNSNILQILLQTLRVRKETLIIHKNVAEEIEKRVNLLVKAKDRHLLDMKNLEEFRQTLQTDVENKAEKLDEINNKQEELTKRTSTLLLRLVSASPESISTKKNREMLEMFKTKMNMLNSRIEEAKEKWNVIQTQSSINTNKLPYGQRSFRLTLEQELVIKENLSETGSSILDMEKKIRDLRTTINLIVA